ncbi:MAG: flagellar M-ring protein FliF [Alphaproteobacteria bacterium]|nr:flagellar M-ring protein FliF [Alphaproteobacteria bacterium]
MDSLIQTLRTLGPIRLAAIGIVALSLLGFFTFMTTRMTSGQMALLYSDLEGQDSSAIAKKLDSMKIPFEVSADGKTIKVSSDMVGKARMAAAGEGLPRGGSIGYEIFDQKEGFGTTSFVQNINHLRALEGELSRTISTLNTVSSARVHLVLPQRELFSRTESHATASVFLRLRGVLSGEQVSAIKNLIAAAVPQLHTDNISIVDDKGNLLAKPKGSEDQASIDGANQTEMRSGFEVSQARKIEDLLAQSIGFGKVRAKVSAEMDFDRIVTQSEIYDPDSQVVRSQQTTTEESKNAEGGTAGAVSVQNNLPSGIEQGGGSTNNSNNRNEETLNYEINKTVRNQIREGGQIRKLSVAVMVDGRYEPEKDKDGKEVKEGKPVYVARTAEEMDQIKALVRSAINLDTARGDTLEVINMRFQQAEAPADQPLLNMMFGFPKEDFMHLVEILAMAGIGVLVLLLVVRPLLNRVLESANSLGQAAQENTNNLLAAGGGAGQLPGVGGMASGGLLTGTVAGEEDSGALDQMIDIGRVEGRVKASSLRKISEIVEKHPEESVAILRNWIYQENR